MIELPPEIYDEVGLGTSTFPCLITFHSIHFRSKPPFNFPRSLLKVYSECTCCYRRICLHSLWSAHA